MTHEEYLDEPAEAVAWIARIAMLRRRGGGDG